MGHTEHVLDLRGRMLISTDEGVKLGNISAIYLDMAAGKMAALELRTSRLGGDNYYVTPDCIKTVGEDAILISSRADLMKISGTVEPPGTDLKKLQGCWVTTAEGNHLGTMVDLDMSDDFTVSRLILNGNKSLDVDVNKIELGDEIIVPVAYAEGVEEIDDEELSFWQRTLGATREMVSRETDGKTQVHPPGN